MDEDEKVQLRAENEKKKEEILAKATAVADKVSQFKRDYIGAPIRKCMNSCMANKQEFKAVEVPYRQDEKYWIF